MNIYIGIDAVDIKRFAHFHLYSTTQLARLFSPQEIAYCLQTPVKSAERFAARFAAKEALYKALTHAHNQPPCPFLALCKSAEIEKNPYPTFKLDKKLLNGLQQVRLSITHAKELAFAQVLLHKI